MVGRWACRKHQNRYKDSQVRYHIILHYITCSTLLIEENRFLEFVMEVATLLNLSVITSPRATAPSYEFTIHYAYAAPSDEATTICKTLSGATGASSGTMGAVAKNLQYKMLMLPP